MGAKKGGEREEWSEGGRGGGRDGRRDGGRDGGRERGREGGRRKGGVRELEGRKVGGGREEGWQEAGLR